MCRMRSLVSLIASGLAIPAIVLCGSAWGAAPIEFNRDVRPILADTCFKCHGFDKNKREADLRLDIPDEAFKPRTGVDGDEVTPIVAGNLAKSDAWRRIVSNDPDELMPPAKSHLVLTDQQKDVLRRWIEQGAKYQAHWAFIAVKDPVIPQVAHKNWMRNEIDAFILSRLEREGLEPSPEADKRTLIRRVTFDLTGLPPTPEEVEAFVNDSAPDAYEHVVDRLLASPHYGERMTLDWLDAARYGDTHGFNNDTLRSMWPWRDWVINAFNSNKPYDTFLTEQLAGDLIPNATRDQQIATAFNRNHVMNSEGGIIEEEYRVEYVLDRTTTACNVFMGLTVQCARCHDHKFDPISQKDFYRLTAYFNSLDEAGKLPYDKDAPPLLKLPSAAQEKQMVAIAAEIARLETVVKTRHTLAEQTRGMWQPQLRKTLATLNRYLNAVDSEHTAIQSKLDAARKREQEIDATIPTVMVMQEMKPPRKTFVLKRGMYDAHQEEVFPGTPSFLPPMPANAPPNRLGLAMWLTNPNHPLTSRVAVNRFWSQYFGIGIVKTVEDWGTQGEPPSHPELLDWLATRFIKSGWDVKAMQKLIVTSATYRQAARYTPELIERDPENRLLARGPRSRLPAEAIRDNALSLGGLLVDKIGGPSVMPYQPAGLWDDVIVGANYPGTKYVQGHGDDLYRRSMYTFWKRTCPPPALSAFDAPDREYCQLRRPLTDTPLQALVLLNDPTYIEASRKIAERMMRDGGSTPETRIAFLFRLATAHSPATDELTVLSNTFSRQLERYKEDPNAAMKLLAVGESKSDAKLDPPELAAYTAVASMVLNLDEVITK
jgi:hypothetical protein